MSHTFKGPPARSLQLISWESVDDRREQRLHFSSDLHLGRFHPVSRPPVINDAMLALHIPNALLSELLLSEEPKPGRYFSVSL